MTVNGNGGRPAGLPKTGGRQKGTPNRRTVGIQEKLDLIGCDPLVELAKIAQNEKTPVDLQVRCLSEIAPYVYPKRKPADSPNDETPVINVNTKIDPGDADGGDQSKPEA